MIKPLVVDASSHLLSHLDPHMAGAICDRIECCTKCCVAQGHFLDCEQSSMKCGFSATPVSVGSDELVITGRGAYCRDAARAMIGSIRQFFSSGPAEPPEPPPEIPPGQRVYAIGDIHGRLDLFTALVSAIEEDDRQRRAARTTIILLGDLVDRGPDSAGVIAAARALKARRDVRILAGNHEEMFLESLDCIDTLKHFLRYGGRETVRSFLPDPAIYDRLTFEETQEAMWREIDAQDLDFLRHFDDNIVIGDYLFVHAGIRPEVPLEEQRLQDLRWIREPFLSHGGSHGRVVVHGHTITDAPEILANRIGIDTGAFMSGRLTALGLERTQRWLIETDEGPDAITIRKGPV
jgi:serine/threonine protein phosphatase 1